MFDNLEPTVRTAVMTILSGLYESGTVDKVDLRDVMRLFGVSPDTAPDDIDPIFSFRDSEWVQSYLEFKEFINSDDRVTVVELDDSDASFIDTLKAQLEAKGFDVEDQSEELKEFTDANDLSPDRKLH